MIPKYLIAAAGAVALALGTPAVIAQDKGSQDKSKQASAKKGSSLSKEDQLFVKHMGAADMAEVEAGKIASQKASNPEVKKYAEKMVQEHTKMLEEGKQLAQKKGITEPPQVDSKHRENLKDLQAKSGDDFDREYITQMVQDHEGALNLVQKAAKDAKDPDIKAHAQKGEPHIKAHLDEARKLRASLNASAGGTAKRSDKK